MSSLVPPQMVSSPYTNSGSWEYLDHLGRSPGPVSGSHLCHIHRWRIQLEICDVAWEIIPASGAVVHGKHGMWKAQAGSWLLLYSRYF